MSLNSDGDDARFSLLQRVIRGRMPELDGLRGVAILLVLWHNVTAGQYTGGAIAKLINLLANTGWVGVQLFFVLSGFLITGILLDEKGAPQQIRNFYARRVLRIFPVYYCALAIIFVLLPAVHATPGWMASPDVQQFWYWLYLNNWSSPFVGDVPALGHFWSLAVEEQFYLLWPVCVIFMRRRTLLALCLLLMVSAPITRLILTTINPELALATAYKFTIARWDALGVGALIALVARQRSWFNYMRMLAPIIFYGAIAYIVVFALIGKNYAAVGEGAWFNQSAAALLFAGLLFRAIQPLAGLSATWRWLLTSAPLRSIGKYSYAIYVVHMPMIYTLVPIWKSHTTYLAQRFPMLSLTGLSVAVFVGSYMLAFCSWRLLERPCLQLRRYFVRAEAAAAA